MNVGNLPIIEVIVRNIKILVLYNCVDHNLGSKSYMAKSIDGAPELDG
jgi:hypothetical protein